MLRRVLSMLGLTKPADTARPRHARSSRWPAVRRAHLEQFPACAACGGTEGVEVHHVRPVHLFPHLELDPTNLLTLCERPGRNCHLVFGHLLSFREGWNARVRADAADYRAKVEKRQQGGSFA